MSADAQVRPQVVHRTRSAMGQTPAPGDGMASRGAVLMGTTDDRSRMRKGVIQINAAALLPPNDSRSKLLNSFSGLDASRLGRRAGACGGPPRP